MASLYGVIPLLISVFGLLNVNVVSTHPASGPAELPPNSVQRLPITEMTVFKDGHVFVHRQGNVRLKENRVVLDELPAPVLGTFWSYAADPGMTLRSVVAGNTLVASQRPAVSIHDLLEANKGKLAHITEADGRDYEATILDVPHAAAPQPPATEAGRIVLLQMRGETRAIPIDRIRDIGFRQEPATSLEHPEKRGVLTLDLATARGEMPPQTRVGMVYLQKGFRWIPNYKVEIDGEGHAIVKLQATLINELADVKEARLQLVVGVPSFAFKDNLDPISLQETAARLGQHFQQNSQTAFALSNAIMWQAPRYEPTPGAPAQPSGPTLGPEFPEGARSEDLFIFTIENISLAKGERMVVPVAEYNISYNDAYVLEIPFAPPVEVVRSLESRSPQELQNARLMAAPKVMHKLRLANSTSHPFTTAPALIVQNNRALGQGMMTYTAAGGTTDLDLTVAVNVRAKRSDVETERVPNALHWNTLSLARVGLAGSISITNSAARPVELEVIRHVLGHVDSVGQDGKAEQTNSREDAWPLAAAPAWFRWYSWPWWWYNVNGMGRIRWSVRLEPGESVELDYAWHYFWN